MRKNNSTNKKELKKAVAEHKAFFPIASKNKDSKKSKKIKFGIFTADNSQAQRDQMLESLHISDDSPDMPVARKRLDDWNQHDGVKSNTLFAPRWEGKAAAAIESLNRKQDENVVMLSKNGNDVRFVDDIEKIILTKVLEERENEKAIQDLASIAQKKYDLKSKDVARSIINDVAKSKDFAPDNIQSLIKQLPDDKKFMTMDDKENRKADGDYGVEHCKKVMFDIIDAKSQKE